MSLSVSGEVKQDVVEPAKGMIKCRIPQRMASARQKPPLNKPKPPYEVLADMGEKKSRAKSANRVKDELSIGRPAHPAPRSTRAAAPEHNRFPNTTRIHKPAKMQRKVNVVRQTGKLIRSITGMFVTEPQSKKAISKQEKISLRSEDLDYLNHCTPVSDKESTINFSESENLKKLIMVYQQNGMQSVKMKSDLNEHQKPKCEAVPVQPRPTRSPALPRSNESRPKSASRVKDDLSMGRPAHPAPRTGRPAERDRFPITTRRPSTIPRKINDVGQTNKPIRPTITVPCTGPQTQRSHTRSLNYGLPDQEAISKQENVSFNSDDFEDLNRGSLLITEQDSTLCYTQSDKMMRLKTNWQKHMSQFEKMKSDLNDRQKAIVELYSFMRNTHAKMKGLGQKAIMPPSEDLRIMNVAKLSAEQLLQLCSSVRPDDQFLRAGQPKGNQMSRQPLAIDMNKLFAMPSKLVATCEQTLFKRKEIIDWFETLKSEDKGIGMNKLSKKINEFNAENEMLKCSLEQAKGEFIKDLNEIIEFMRKTINETVALQLRTEELTYTLSELNSQNADLRKQIHNAEHLRPNTNKAKLEELEKELKDERSKKIITRERLSRYEGQVKISAERVSQLEAALEQARSQTYNLERKVQQLNDQNQTLQTEFDVEIHKLRESIKENTMHLELIAEAREQLQAEKEELVKRLQDLSNNYNESLQTIKQEMNASVKKVIEAEKKYEDLVEEKKSVEAKLESLCSKLVESELRFNDLTKELQETKNNLSHAMTFEKELSSTKRDLDFAVIEIEDYRKKVAELSGTIKEYENNIKESISLEEDLKSNLINKQNNISDLETQKSLLEKQLQESESNMGSYQEQLTCLKNHIAELQKDFGEFENLNELHEMINQQRAKLLEATRQNGELAIALQKRDVELEKLMDTTTEQEKLLAQRNGLIKMLSNKDEEHTNIIKLLRNNLEMRNQADMDLNQQINEKNAEINTLLTNVETRKQQISQLEKIILTLEEQMRKASMQRKKDQDKFDLLEKKVAEYEQYHTEPRRNELPTNNLDSIIKILEDELGTPFDPSLINKEHDFGTPKRDHTRENFDNFECHKVNNNQTIYPNEHETVPTKIDMGNLLKNAYISSNDEQYRSEKLDRKKAITNMDTQKWIHIPEPINVFAANTPTIRDSNYPPFRGLLPASSHLKNNLMSRNIQLTNNQLRDEKKSKMFKIAGHRL